VKGLLLPRLRCFTLVRACLDPNDALNPQRTSPSSELMEQMVTCAVVVNAVLSFSFITVVAAARGGGFARRRVPAPWIVETSLSSSEAAATLLRQGRAMQSAG